MVYIQNSTAFLIACLSDKSPAYGKYRPGWTTGTNNPIEKERILNNSPLYGISCKLSNCIGIDIDLYKFYLLEAHQFRAEKDTINHEIKIKGNIYFVYHNESAAYYIIFKSQSDEVQTKKITDVEYIDYLNELRVIHPHHLKTSTQKYKYTRQLITREHRNTAELIADYYNTKRDPHNGFLQLIAFCDRFNLDDPSDFNGVWMRTWQTLTPSGGKHYLLRNTREINQNALHHLGYPNLDLRWRGHLCNGNGYEVVNDVEPQVAPTELLEILQEARAGTDERSGKYNGTMPPLSNAHTNPKVVAATGTRAFHHGYIQRVIDGSVRQMISATDNRNDKLNQLCFSLGRYLSEGIITPGNSKEQLYQLFVTRMRAAGLKVGLTESETMKTIFSGLRAGEAKAIEPAQHKPYKGVKNDC